MDPSLTCHSPGSFSVLIWSLSTVSRLPEHTLLLLRLGALIHGHARSERILTGAFLMELLLSIQYLLLIECNLILQIKGIYPAHTYARDLCSKVQMRRGPITLIFRKAQLVSHSSQPQSGDHIKSTNLICSYCLCYVRDLLAASLILVSDFIDILRYSNPPSRHYEVPCLHSPYAQNFLL
jgi:hypothetical protein